MSKYVVHEIDPVRRVILTRRWPGFKKNYQNLVAKAVQSKQVGHTHVMLAEGGKNVWVAAPQYLEDDTPGFRLRGTQVITVGRGLLFGTGEQDGFVGCPLSHEDVERLIVWLDPEDCVEETPEIEIVPADGVANDED